MPSSNVPSRVLRVAVVDDDAWKRSAMAEQLDATGGVDVVNALDQDQATAWPTEMWKQTDVAVVDVFDDRAPGEIGTDLYSGIMAVECLAPLPVRTLAIVPNEGHPLVQLRLCQANPDAVYSRWELPSLEELSRALFDPSPRPPAVPHRSVLSSFGAERLNANEVVRLYLGSALAGRLEVGTGLKHVSMSRRELDRFRIAVAAAGFAGTEELNWASVNRRAPRWPDTRACLLRLLGRLDAPPTEFDRPWLLH